MRNGIIALCLVIFGLAVALGLLEVTFRLGAKLLPPEVAWSDRPVVYFSHEESKTLQELPVVAKRPGEIRIAVVGDSFAFAPYLQFDDTFSARLERWLNLNKKQPPVRVLNYGVPRYSTSHQVAVVDRAIRDGADAVLLQITLNDPEIKPYRPTGMDETHRDRSMERAIRGSFFRSCVRFDEFGVPQFTCWILRHSRIAQFVVRRVMNERSVREYRQYFFELFEKEAEWSGFQRAHREIQEQLKNAKVPSVAVVFPLFGFPNDASYPFSELHQKVGSLMTELGVPTLDLFESYRNIPLDRLVVIPGKDRHPNEIGHRVAAEAIYQWLAGLPSEATRLPPQVFARHTVSKRIGIPKTELTVSPERD